MNTAETIKIMAMGAILALLGMMVVNQSGRTTAADGASAGKMMAVAAGYNKYITVVLIDTDTQHMAAYTGDETTFGLSYARFYGYDLGITEIDKFKRTGYSVKETKKMYDDSAKSKGP